MSAPQFELYYKESFLKDSNKSAFKITADQIKGTSKSNIKRSRSAPLFYPYFLMNFSIETGFE